MNTEEEKVRLVCISCPIGCSLEAEKNSDGSVTVTGNQCPRGEEYAREEIESPRRIVTTTVKMESRHGVRLPVRTDKPLPVDSIFPLLEKLHSMILSPPVLSGDVILRNFMDTGVSVIASFSVGE